MYQLLIEKIAGSEIKWGQFSINSEVNIHIDLLNMLIVWYNYQEICGPVNCYCTFLYSKNNKVLDEADSLVLLCLNVLVPTSLLVVI